MAQPASHLRLANSGASEPAPDLNELLTSVGKGDETAFGAFYDALGGSVYMAWPSV